MAVAIVHVCAGARTAHVSLRRSHRALSCRCGSDGLVAIVRRRIARPYRSLLQRSLVLVVAKILDRAFRAVRCTGLAYVTPMENQPMMRVVFKFIRA